MLTNGVASTKPIRVTLLALLMFSATSLYTMDTRGVYIGITVVVSVITAIVSLMDRSKAIQRTMDLDYSRWLTLVLALICTDAFFRTRAGELNYDFILFTWISQMVVCCILLMSNDQHELIEVLCIASEIAAISVCIYVFITEGNLGLRDDGRIGEALSGNVITVAMHLTMYSFGILVRYLKTKKKVHLGLYFGVLLVTILSGSKVVLLYLICVGFLYVRYANPSKRALRFLIVASFGLAVLWLIFTNDYLYRVIGYRTLTFLQTLGNRKGAGYSHSTTERMYLISTAWRCFLQHPIFGGGYNFVASMPPYYVYSHNNYLELLSSYGILGFVIFYIRYVICFRDLQRHQKINRDTVFIQALLIGSLIGDITQITYTAGWMFYYGLLVSSVYVCIGKNCKGLE